MTSIDIYYNREAIGHKTTLPVATSGFKVAIQTLLHHALIKSRELLQFKFHILKNTIVLENGCGNVALNVKCLFGFFFLQVTSSRQAISECLSFWPFTVSAGSAEDVQVHRRIEGGKLRILGIRWRADERPKFPSSWACGSATAPSSGCLMRDLFKTEIR